MNKHSLNLQHSDSRLPMTLFRRNAFILALWLLALAAALFAYTQALHAPFVSDDHIYLVENRKLLDLRPAELWKLFAEPFNTYEFLPLRDLSYWVDLALFGLDPTALRLHNFVLYALACALVFLTTAKLCGRLRADTSQAPAWTAAVTTALFAVHPAHVESVVWISGRKDLMCAIFSLAAIWMALEIDARTRRAALLIAGIAVAVIGAMLSKATAIVVAPLVTLLALLYFRHDTRNIPRPTLLALALVPLAVAALSFIAFYRASSIAVAQHYGVESVERFFAILGWLARLSVSIEDRHFFYPVLDTAATPYMVIAGVAVLGCALPGLAWAVRRNSLRGFCAFAFFIFCLPYTQVLPFGTISLASDRQLFLAVWPVCLLLAIASKRMVYHMALAALGIAWLAETIDRTSAWTSWDEITRRELAAWPGHELPLAWKVGLLVHAGRYDEAQPTAQAIRRQDVRTFVTTLADTAATVGRSQHQRGMLPVAMGELWQSGEAIDTPPADARWNMPLLYIYHVVGTNAVKKLWSTLVQTYPQDAALQYNAGLWLLQHRQYSLAEPYLRAAVNLLDTDAAFYGTAAKNWGIALWASGDKAGAEKALRLALQATTADQRAACLLKGLLADATRKQEAASIAMNCDNGEINTAGKFSQ